MTLHEDRLADAVNQEPIVYNDCTSVELTYSVVCGMSCGLLFSCLLMTIFTIMFSLVLGLLSGLGFSWLSMFILKNIRQKYYETWLSEQFFNLKKSLGLLANIPFVNESKRYGKGGKRRG
jgi:Protein of unknown function (DUF3487)